MSWEIQALAIGAILIVAIMVGIPIAVSLGLVGVSLLIALIGFDKAVYVMTNEIADKWTSYTLLAVPLFVFMGQCMLFGGVSQDIFDVASKWLQRLPAGLCMVTIGSCAMYGTLSGSDIGAVVSLGPLTVPQMLKRGYDRRLACGSLGAAGGLAHLIPPGTLMVIYASITDQSVGEMFMAAFIPGFMLAGIYGIIAMSWALLYPKAAPKEAVAICWGDRLRVLSKAVAPVSIFLVVLGGIYTGAATVNEAAAVGCVAGLVLCLIRRRLTFSNLKALLSTTVALTAFVVMIIGGAMVFGWAVNYLAIPQRLADLMVEHISSPLLFITLLMVIYIILGMFLDPMACMLITVPIVLPILLSFGYNPIWFGVLYLINMEMATVTPPVGLVLYVVHGVVPEVPLGDIIKGCLWFCLGDLTAVGLVIAFPQLALWLPSTMF